MYKSKNHSKFSLKAHLVFVIKYRKPLLMDNLIANQLIEEELRKHYYKEHTFWSDGHFVC